MNTTHLRQFTFEQIIQQYPSADCKLKLSDLFTFALHELDAPKSVNVDQLGELYFVHVPHKSVEVYDIPAWYPHFLNKLRYQLYLDTDPDEQRSVTIDEIRRAMNKIAQYEHDMYGILLKISDLDVFEEKVKKEDQTIPEWIGLNQIDFSGGGIDELFNALMHYMLPDEFQHFNVSATKAMLFIRQSHLYGESALYAEMPLPAWQRDLLFHLAYRNHNEKDAEEIKTYEALLQLLKKDE